MKQTKFFFLLAFAQASLAQTFDQSSMDMYMQALNENNKFMGAVYVVRNDQILYSKAIGYSDVSSSKTNRENTKFRLGSISKTLTAALVLKAVEEGKIDLYQSLEDFFPSVDNSENITIEHLLYHRSGIHSFTDDEDFETWQTEPRTKDQLVKRISESRSEFEPDSEMAYSNSNYILLSFILEKVYNKTYGKILKEKILTPLGMLDTHFGGKINPKNNESFSYSFSDNWVKELDTDLSIPMGAGGIISTTSDLTKFGTALFRSKIISENSLSMMTTLKDRFGMGLYQLPILDKYALGHVGAIDGFSTIWAYIPSDDLTIVVLSNGDNYNNKLLASFLAKAAYGQNFELPKLKVINVSETELDAFTGTYASDEMPLKITVFKENGRLVAQATGQGPLPLDAIDVNQFSFDRAGITIQFEPSKSILTLMQGDGVLSFTKE